LNSPWRDFPCYWSFSSATQIKSVPKVFGRLGLFSLTYFGAGVERLRSLLCCEIAILRGVFDIVANLTVVIADTENHALARCALERSVQFKGVKDVLVYSDDSAAWHGYTVSKITKIQGIQDYNNCIIKRLAEDLVTDFALVIQYDGFVLDGKQWTDRYLNYDYIGAPWYDDDGWHVGNGGFSLRSRRLVDSVGAFAMQYSDSINEDVFICKKIRRQLEGNLLKFAPLEVARRFSYEWPVGQWDTFGFHGIFHLPKLYVDNLAFLLGNLSEKTLRRRWKYIYPFLCVLLPDEAEAIRRRFDV